MEDEGIHFVLKATKGGGGNSLRPYSQQRPMGTNLSRCLGLFDVGQHMSTNRLLVLVPDATPHGTKTSLEKVCMLLMNVPEMRVNGAGRPQL